MDKKQFDAAVKAAFKYNNGPGRKPVDQLLFFFFWMPFKPNDRKKAEKYVLKKGMKVDSLRLINSSGEDVAAAKKEEKPVKVSKKVLDLTKKALESEVITKNDDETYTFGNAEFDNLEDLHASLEESKELFTDVEKLISETTKK